MAVTFFSNCIWLLLRLDHFISTVRKYSTMLPEVKSLDTEPCNASFSIHAETPSMYSTTRPSKTPSHFQTSSFQALPVWSISPRSSSQLRFPLVPISQQLLFVVKQLLPRLCGVFCVGSYRRDESVIGRTQRALDLREMTYTQQLRPPDSSPDKIHSKCTLSYRYRIW